MFYNKQELAALLLSLDMNTSGGKPCFNGAICEARVRKNTLFDRM